MQIFEHQAFVAALARHEKQLFQLLWRGSLHKGRADNLRFVVFAGHRRLKREFALRIDGYQWLVIAREREARGQDFVTPFERLVNHQLAIAVQDVEDQIRNRNAGE